MARLFSTLLAARVSSGTEVCAVQCGFRPGMDCLTNCVVLDEVSEMERGLTLSVFFSTWRRPLTPFPMRRSTCLCASNECLVSWLASSMPCIPGRPPASLFVRLIYRFCQVLSRGPSVFTAFQPRVESDALPPSPDAVLWRRLCAWGGTAGCYHLC